MLTSDEKLVAFCYPGGEVSAPLPRDVAEQMQASITVACGQEPVIVPWVQIEARYPQLVGMDTNTMH